MPSNTAVNWLYKRINDYMYWSYLGSVLKGLEEHCVVSPDERCVFASLILIMGPQLFLWPNCDNHEYQLTIGALPN